ncbi:hypothetical protein FB45DRAFT_906960 [Roridomyces roridus]|uniref:Uncharacterized protein n=1 Tax=Roridomyces roridus TaxID=1738132 RepID=A0AAD7C1W0_9AGAR|nr:hypothetical protein FB45DRAFT_906960 [Roridomyces roridus]
MRSRSPFLPRAISISSAQSFDTIKQLPTTPSVLVDLADDQRWSEIVPPESALTFGMKDGDSLSFSAPELLSAPTAPLRLRPRHSPDSPSDAAASDGRSQVLTIGPGMSMFSSPSEYTGTMQYFRENHDSLFPRDGPHTADRPMRGRTQTSSTMDGLDVYLRGSMFGKAHNSNRYQSCFQDLDGEFAFDPRMSFANMWLEYMNNGIKSDEVDDEGFFDTAAGRYSVVDDENNLCSAFSVTTTSTSNYINVENEMDDESTLAWSKLDPPNTPGYSRGLMFPGTPAAPQRLRKPRPAPGPASPADVLHRPNYNHTNSAPSPLPSSPSPPPRSATPSSPRERVFSLPKIARGLGLTRTRSRASNKSEADGPGWVWVDVKDKGRAAA